jgi:cystathionine beta-lyase
MSAPVEKLNGPEFPPTPALTSSNTPTPQNGRRRKYRLATEIVHSDHTDEYGSSSMPIYQTATFYQTGANAGGEYDYTRSGNPTRSQLERHLAKIIGCEKTFAVSTGMSALDVITRVLKPGDEVVTGDDLYGGTNRLLKYLEATNNVIVHHIDTTDTEAVKKALSSKTAMALLETPTNPLIKVCDIKAIADAAHAANKECLVVVDNTVMSPLLQSPLDLGADVSYESGTKYLSGHHDVCPPHSRHCATIHQLS